MSRPISELPSAITDLATDLGEVLYETAVRIKSRMAAPSSGHSGQKVTWDGEVDSIRGTTNQQRAFFATNGFGGGIPHVSANTYELSWKANRIPHGARVTAPHPAGAISGTIQGWQSKIHKGKRVNLLLVLTEELAKLPEHIRTKITTRAGE